MLKIAICDDETVFQNKITTLIELYLQKKQIESEIDCFESGEQFLENASVNLDYSIVFLDVNMKEMNGIETAKIIRELSSDIYIIFVTAYISYALDGYKVDAVRYLLKTDSTFSKSMRECLDTIIEKMNYKEEWMEFEFQIGKMRVALDRIIYVESRLHKTVFSIVDDGIKEYYMYEKLDKIQEKLSDHGFYRVHQSFIVNLKYVKKVERYKATLSVGIHISISKKYFKDVEKQYIRLKGEI